MSDALFSAAAALGFAAVLLMVLCVLTLGPFVTALELADRRGLGSTRWGLVSAACSVLGLAVAVLVLRHGLGVVPLVLAAAATWAAPVALLALGGAGGRLAGERGRHQ